MPFFRQFVDGKFLAHSKKSSFNCLLQYDRIERMERKFLQLLLPIRKK